MTETTLVGGGRPEAKPSPLIRVLAQVRWPVMTGFVVDAVADEFAARIGADYPLREKAQELGFLLTPEGVTEQAGEPLHRFVSVDRTLAVTLATTSITLETTAYTTHDDFIPRFIALVREIKVHLPLQRWDRFGYRYTNRFSEERDVVALQGLFDPVVLGPIALDFADPVTYSVGETIYEGDGGSLLVKSAYLPANASIDPTIQPAPTRSWVLDLDAFAVGPSSAFEDTELSEQANLLSRKAKRFFERVTTDEFRSRFAF